MFRNVRTEPRRFNRSRTCRIGSKWAERKERIEAEVAGEQDPDAAPAQSIRFRSGRTGGDRKAPEWKERRQAQIRARYAMLRAVLIAAGLVWLAARDGVGRPVIFRMY